MAALPAFEDHARQEVRHTTCYMCACRCGVKVTLEDGRIRFVQGNPNHPVNRGVLCGKGNAAIMKQCSPAKLRGPMMRRPGAERGAEPLVPVSWETALDTLAGRLRRIRADDPNKLAFFTGRDQMQALTGLWASQFGTLNWAAHGGFCSVNMAAAGLSTTGFSFWEFGEPDWELTRHFMLWGVAEDHSSNPLKIGLKRLKERGVKIVAINPVRTGYQAIADEWVPIRPGTDGLLALSMAHVLMRSRTIDEEYLARFTNAPWLVVDDPGSERHGLLARGDDGEPLVWDQEKGAPASARQPGVCPALFGEYPGGGHGRVRTAMTLIGERVLSEEHSPRRAAEVCGIPAADIERLAAEVGAAAFAGGVSVDTPWTDWAGNRRGSFVGRPVSMHAMRGIAAHSNGFQSCRSIHLLQALVGSIDAPGGHLAKPPYPRHVPGVPRPAREAGPGRPLAGSPLGMPRGPEDLAVDAGGAPLRIDKAFSWDAPLAAHGMLHMVVANAVRGDPYPIDTLLVYMANIAWNSSMNTAGTMEMLRAKDAGGEHKIPHLVVVDAFHSETAAFADLVLPDTTYFERHDAISLLDRPISEAHAVCDSIRAPVLEPEHDTRPWQEVLVDLAGRLGFPAFVREDGSPRYRDYQDFIVNYEKEPGIGFLAGWRGKDGGKSLKGEPNPGQWERYIGNECYFKEELPPSARYFRGGNRDYLDYARDAAWIRDGSPVTVELYSELLRKFQLAGEGKGAHVPPLERQRRSLREHFDPVPFWHPPLEHAETDVAEYPFHSVTQRPMFMYHSWDSQNAWLRQIADTNPLFIHERRAGELGIRDGDPVWVRSRIGRVAARAKLMEGLQPDTVWTWNAIAKHPGAWGLGEGAREGLEGFLMNHLIGEWLPDAGDDGAARPNSDPVTGQAAWYDLRVSVERMSEADADALLPPDSLPPLPGADLPGTLRYATHRPVNLVRPLGDCVAR